MGFLAANLLPEIPNEGDDRIGRWIVVEALISCAIFALGCLLWACFTPRWLERLVETAGRRVMVVVLTIFFVVVVFPALAIAMFFGLIYLLNFMLKP